MIHITYKNKDQDDRKLSYSENNLAEIGYDIKELLDKWSTILLIYRK